MRLTRCRRASPQTCLPGLSIRRCADDGRTVPRVPGTCLSRVYPRRLSGLNQLAPLRRSQHMHALDVPGHGDQAPLNIGLVQSAHVHLAPAHHPLGDAEHRLGRSARAERGCRSVCRRGPADPQARLLTALRDAPHPPIRDSWSAFAFRRALCRQRSDPRPLRTPVRRRFRDQRHPWLST